VSETLIAPTNGTRQNVSGRCGSLMSSCPDVARQYTLNPASRGGCWILSTGRGNGFPIRVLRFGRRDSSTRRIELW
jgi:hypothetical protein